MRQCEAEQMRPGQMRSVLALVVVVNALCLLSLGRGARRRPSYKVLGFCDGLMRKR